MNPSERTNEAVDTETSTKFNNSGFGQSLKGEQKLETVNILDFVAKGASPLPNPVISSELPITK